MIGFRKKSYQSSEFVSDLFRVAGSLPDLAGALIKGKASGAFREKVMLAVTGVNECRYCAFVHSNLARIFDVADEEITQVMKLGTGIDPDSDDQPAIQFARHYAQTNQRPDPDMVASFRKFYGIERADELLLYIRLIYFANLSGNTFDAFLSRLRGT